MSKHTATITWHRGEARFTDNRYSRRHLWRFDGGLEVAASASPHVVAVPISDASAVDPEEAFVASLASCHMLWFLSLAAEQGHVVDTYVDAAVGNLGKDAQGRFAITDVVLHPHVRFGGDHRPDAAAHRALHEAAHARCFIANSVKTTLHCEPVDATDQ